MSEDVIEKMARAICKSGKFECGQGCCAPICMEALGSARRNCAHVVKVHGKLASLLHPIVEHAPSLLSLAERVGKLEEALREIVDFEPDDKWEPGEQIAFFARHRARRVLLTDAAPRPE